MSENIEIPVPHFNSTVEVDAVSRVNFASAQNSTPVLRGLCVRNVGDQTLRGVRLVMTPQPAFCREKSWVLPDIASGEAFEIADRDLSLDHGFLDGLDEAEHGGMTFQLRSGDKTVAETIAPIELLARDEWGGVGGMAQILAAFVAPNDPAVARILKDASRLLEQRGLASGLGGYQRRDPRRVFMLAAAIWSAATALKLTYAEPPKSFEREGQKVRDPGRVLGEGLATCLDSTLLLCAALEAAGFNPVVIFTKGHAFAGVWLNPIGFRSAVEPDVTELRKAIAAHELVVFETTLLCRRPVVDFAEAVAQGARQLSEVEEHLFDQAVDISHCRAAGIRPLASRRDVTVPEVVEDTVDAAPLPPMPDFDMLPGDLVEETPTDASGRIERWQQKLLDLSLRNRLLNFADTKQTIPLFCPDVPRLEDMLADGKAFTLISLADENPVGERDAALHMQRTGEDIEHSFTLRQLDNRRLCATLTGKDLAGRLINLARKAKSDLQEGGANTLFLAVGFLRWKKSPDDVKSYRAPLLLLPIRLIRRSAGADHRLSHHEDDVRFNATLLQFLQRDFGLRIPGLEGDLPQDASGIDVPRIFALIRAAVRDAPGFEVVEDAAISTFSFAKFLMWKDLVDRTDDLRRNRLVKHLIDSPDQPFSVDGAAGMPQPRDIDRRIRPRDLLTPLPADSSQLAAVVAAEKGHDFVIIGPPGTGKSQTIANMIAHCLAHGKTVLFVAEKSAALNVVYRRLKHYGLGDACLELHSSKSDRKSVLAQLGASWDRPAGEAKRKWIKVTEDLEVSRDRLNAYVEALHAPGSHGRSIFEAISLASGQELSFKLSFARITAHNRRSFDDLARLSRDLGPAWAAAREGDALGSVMVADWSFGWQEELLVRAEAAATAASHARDAARALSDALGLPEDPDCSTERLALLSRYADAARRAGAEDFRAAFSPEFDRFSGAVSELETAIAGVRSARSALSALSAQYADNEIPRIPLDALDRDWREASAKVWPLSFFAKRRVSKLLQSYAESGQADPERDIATLRRLRNDLTAVKASPLAASPAFAGENTDAARLSQWLSDAASLRGSVGALRQAAKNAEAVGAAVEALLSPGVADAAPVRLAAVFASSLAALNDAVRKHAEHAGGAPETSTLSALRHALDAIVAQKARLADRARWVSVNTKAQTRGLGPLIAALESGALPSDEAEAAFLAAYFAWWTPRAMDKAPALRGFLAWEHEDLRATFRRLDQEAQGLAAAQVRRRLSHGLPKQDAVARRSELGTLRHQLGLQRPSMPIRTLIAEMPTTFTKLAPCVLMSPLSVAQYLPADHPGFDMVIFDEASQITTWDAVGAIARGRQSVIVGDPKQLPPTNFFGRAQSDENGVEEYEKDLPSILDEAAAAGLPTHQLNWHYRSRDESLIAFSNSNYYGGRLVTFPAPTTSSGALRLHRIKGVFGRGKGRTNRAEAEAIVEHAVSRMTQWLMLPEQDRKTLGVITFNTQQQELILDLLDAARRDEPELEWFFEEDREEPVIVKNLENIQGDERDVMLFSITFGPDAAGKLTMNFGALNRDGGEKRLNVAVTRSREELHVFSSIDAHDIDLTRTKATGVAHLKQFIDFVARGPVALAAVDVGSLGPAENPFEESVADALRAKGWEVRTQIGVSGFRIDLGVVHPDHAGAFLAGVECDGATYHSSATARDRDQIRENVLNGLGWTILRVWSTDWFRSMDEALERLQKGLTAALEASRADDDAADEDDGDEAEAARSEPPENISPAEIATDPIPAERVASFIDATEAPAVHLSTEGFVETAPPRPAESADEEALVRMLLGEDGTEPEYEKGGPKIPGASTPNATSDPVHRVALHPAPVPAVNVADEPRSIAPDPDRFYDEAYTPVIQEMIDTKLAKNGPVLVGALARHIARLHGFQRTGTTINARVLSCLQPNCISHEEHGKFVWPSPPSGEPVPLRVHLNLMPQERPSAEIAGAIREHWTMIDAADDPVLELSKILGVTRLWGTTRLLLEKILEKENGPSE